MEIDNIIHPNKILYSHFKDIVAILLATLIISFGVFLLRQAGALTGSSAGVAFLISYLTPCSFSSVFFFINLPFYWFSVRRMGWEFTLKTFLAVGLVSILTYCHSVFLHFSVLNAFYATFFGNVAIGIGFIILFKHKASLGGINILALWLQDQIGLSAGKLQMIVDTCVVLASLFVVSTPMLFASIIGAIILNIIVTFNYGCDFSIQ